MVGQGAARGAAYLSADARADTELVGRRGTGSRGLGCRIAVDGDVGSRRPAMSAVWLSGRCARVVAVRAGGLAAAVRVPALVGARMGRFPVLVEVASGGESGAELLLRERTARLDV